MRPAIGTTVVFASYQLTQLKNDSSGQKVKNNWYPTIYFHDLEKNQVTWKISGAMIFVSIDDQKNVTIIANEIWTELTEKEFKQKVS